MMQDFPADVQATDHPLYLYGFVGSLLRPDTFQLSSPLPLAPLRPHTCIYPSWVSQISPLRGTAFGGLTRGVGTLGCVTRTTSATVSPTGNKTTICGIIRGAAELFR